MKKFLFSFLLIGTFATYALYVQQVTRGDAGAPVILDKKLPTTPPPSQPPPTPAPQTPPIQTNPPPQPIPQSTGQYRNGTYTGNVVDAYYGNVQVRAVIQNGKISDVIFLDHPQDRNTSIEINNYAMPLLTSEAIQAQHANVDVISGATATSDAFVQSLASALVQAKI